MMHQKLLIQLEVVQVSELIQHFQVHQPLFSPAGLLLCLILIGFSACNCPEMV